jgi:hypothetical protein|tara:strand:- start:2299 stop:2775 length:477 start_codon:yes stop_codon:yes gene_type:complete
MTTEFKAKPVLEDKFWIVEEQGQKIGTLRKNEDKFVFSNENGVKFYHSKKSILSDYGKDFFVAKIVKEADDSEPNEVHGFKCSTKPHNSMYDIQKRLPLFTKSKDSKSLYCSGYYVIKFDKGWVKSFCPKLITLQRYAYKGPFKTDLEMKQVLSNVNK